MTPKSLRSGLAWRFVVRPVTFAIPFAIFFLVLTGDPLGDFLGYYIASLIFSVLIVLFVEANHRWVVPRLIVGDHARTGAPLAIEIASYALSSLLGSVVAALILHWTIAPGFLGSARAVATVLVFSGIFSALILGLIYAVSFQRRYVGQVRLEAEAKAREEQEMRIAAEIQQALLPPRLRSAPTYAAAAATIPCRAIGGDFFEYFDLPGGKIGFALADVAGKGPPAAIMAAMMQGILSSAVGPERGPAATLERVNRALAERTVETRFATLFYGVLDPEGGLVTCNAGHNPPILLGVNGSIRRLEKGGLLVGPFREASYEEETLALSAGESLVLFSDGVTDAEAPGGEQFGEERLLPCLHGASGVSSEEVVDRILNSVRAFAGDHPPADDITVLVVRYLGRT